MEELLLALACLDAKQTDEAAKWHAKAIARLDRYRQPIQMISAVGAIPTGVLQGAAELLKQPVDPRYNSVDWETWYECEVFRAEVEAKMNCGARMATESGQRLLTCPARSGMMKGAT